MTEVGEELTCRKCLRSTTYRAPDREYALKLAAAVGWRSNDYGFICPRCPGSAEPWERYTVEDAAALLDAGWEGM